MSYLNPRWENVAFAAFLILPTVPYPVCAAIVEEPSVSELMALGAPTLAWDKIQKKPQLNQKLQAEEIAQHD